MPEPTRLILFERLARARPGTKVRFLACVYSYDSETAKLILHDRYASSLDNSTPPAIINIDNILENLSRELLEVGAWINVVGTVRANDSAEKPSKSWWRKATGSGVTGVDLKRVPCPLVDATMIWSAGAVKLEEYREAVTALAEAAKDG